MKSAKHIEKLVKNLDVAPSDEMHERALADAMAAHVAKRPARTTGLLPFGALAAGLLLLSLVAALALRESATPVYAVEQTVAAIKKVPVVHIIGRDWDDKRIEMWMKVHPETGLLDSCHIRYLDDDRSVVSTPKNTYDRDGRTNTVHIKDGPSVTSIFCLGDFFQGMERLAKTLDGQITYCEVTDSATKRTLLELKLSTPQTEIVCLIDPKSKLPSSIHVTRGGRFGSCDILKHATEIHYRDTPPEGLFDFTIPAGANISVETSQDVLQNLPVSVLRYCGSFHLKTVQELGQPQRIPVNTRMYFVDSEFNLHDGAFVGIYNDSNEVWQGEVGVFNVDPPHMALFDAATGKKQQIRLVQHRPSPPGRFRVYWQFEEPLRPGDTRYGIYWTSGTQKLPDRPTAGEHQLVMNNCFGVRGIENFLLIVPKEMDVHNGSRPYESEMDVGDYRIYAWQRHLPQQRIVNQVEVVLSRASADYADDYIRDNTGRVLVEIPEVFELANIAIAISDVGLKDPYKVNKAGAYYQRVLAHFLSFKNHLLIAHPALHHNYGYMFRDNSICYAFAGDKIVAAGPYRNIRDPDLFQQQLALIEDFAKVSGFRQFYRDNLPFYQQQIELYRRNAPLQKMWTWLEERFPARHNCYKVVFSPLLGGSHETCNFKRKGFSETIMFVSGPGEPPHEIEDGFLSRAVFTEIDHNYVNSITSQHIEQVNKAFADLTRWSSGAGYESPELTFNEYMTWAAFILYACDTYDAKYFEIVKEHVVRQMVEGRKFVRFREFTGELLRLYHGRTSGQSIADLYPAILAWAQADALNAPKTAGWLADDAWMIIGPFDNTNGAGFDASYAPEKEIDFSKEYAGKEGPVKWFKPKRTRSDGLVDLSALVGQMDWVVAYAAAIVPSPKVRTMELRVGSDDDVKVWLNGELVLTRSTDRAAFRDQDVAPVTLRQGDNQLLLKVSNRRYSWGFYARIVDANVPRYAAKVTRQGALEDLDFLVTQLKAKHPRPFARVSEKDFNTEVERIKANLWDETPLKDFSLSIAALLALVADDHTRHEDFTAYGQHVSQGGKVLPVKFRCKDNRMTIEAWSPEIAPAHMKVGDAVTAANGEPMASLLRRYGRYICVDTELQKNWKLEGLFDKYQVLLGDTRDDYVLQMQDAEGKAYTETLPAVKPWLNAYKDSKPKSPDFHYQFYDGGKVCLFKLRTFNWNLRTELEAKATALVDEMKQRGTQIVILDLRGNGGGNSAMGNIVVTKLIDKPHHEFRLDTNHSWPVQLALLCDRGTYSAASFEAMCIKDYRMGLIAGEETGGRASGSGNIVDVALPNSHLVCGIATGWFTRRAGYDDGRGVLPDLPLDVKLDDRVLVEKICACLRNGGPTGR